MKLPLLPTLLACGLMHLLPLEAGAQRPQLNASQNKQYKVKSKAGPERIRDKSKPVRAALEEQYAKIAEAYKHDDPEAVLQLRTPGFSVRMPNGQRWDAEQSAGYVRAGFEQVERTVRLSFDIATLDVQGDTAGAFIHQQWSRIQTMKGELRRVETSACQRETWVNTAEGWRLHIIDNVQPLVWKVDGKRVDPSTPYDPNAPPYEPTVEKETRCSTNSVGTQW